ncbi:ABC transporter substrate-binding protein [Streptomyces diastatochromogenes]|uniref:ABC transporter substrate-binding protein n=1 Tax=Streptomyces diastatochromogenes TaxID=42236 RepID=UPI000B916703|nr:ABC transporter substrate-binding protein [Streptomyces diastatochromogenes]MCZ0987178.1 ABC transporter substrate-binding protein [Streptomyces diastatochromogenes]
MRRLTAPLVRCALVLGLLLAPVACDAPEKDKVTIMVPWSDKEFAAFYAVVKDFKSHHPDIDVEPQVTRALTQQLDAAVAADAEPDLAVLPSVGAIAKYREEGALRKLAVDTKAYVQPFRGLGMNGADVYAVPVKADVKSLIWYDARVTPRPPESWTALRSRSDKWCLGLESGPTSGWPGADWIADILLADQGVDTYKAWASGGAKWDSTPVKDAWTAWGALVKTPRKDASTLGFRDATAKMTKKECSLSHGTLSAMPFASAQVKDDQYTYVPSSRQALEVSADFVGKFTGNKSADVFIQYLASAEAQQAWVNEPGFALSANRKVTEYANTTQGRIAGMLRSPRYTLCFSAADAMDPDVSAAFYRAVLDYTNGKEPTPLLTALDKVQKELGYSQPNSPPPPEPLCSSPNRP